MRRGRGQRRRERHEGRPASLQGRLDHHGRFAFLLSETPGAPDLMIRGPSLRLAMDGDRVEVRVVPGDGRPQGVITKVLERGRSTAVGPLHRGRHGWELRPKSMDPVEVLGSERGLLPEEGKLAVVRITRWPGPREGAGGPLVELLGHPDAPGVRVRSVLRERELPERFPDAALREAEAWPDAVPAASWRGRRQLFELPLFTIDGADAKDFDDAVSLESLPGGRLRLGVHIADVSHYVKPGSPVDAEARKRATSVYLPGSVVPMLPPKLSDHLCSLRPKVERLALSCFLEVDDEGTVHDADFAETVIRSARRFTYEEVEQVLEGKKVEDVSREVEHSVREMGRLAATLLARRLERGSLDIELPEYTVAVDGRGEPTGIVRRPRLRSHRLIEDFMILANEAAARRLKAAARPALHRIHEPPDPGRLEELGEAARRMGLNAGHLAAAGAQGLQALLKQAEHHPLRDIVMMMVLRSQKQAVYTHRPGVHFGLASKAYCHFTSPIRRYPDLIVHRALKAALGGGGGPGKDEVAGLGGHCSERERAAADAEREAVDLLRARLLRRMVGHAHPGVVTRVVPLGCFVALDGTGASGLARGAKRPLGSKVTAVLESVDEATGELELRLK